MKSLASAVVFGLFLLVNNSCTHHLYPHSVSNQSYTISSEVPMDSSIYQLLSPYKRGVDTQMQEVLGKTDIMLTKAQPESSLGNFVADAQLVAAQKIDKKVAISVCNYGGIRLPYIAAGVITKEKIYELMPFDNMLTIVEVSGSQVQQLCDVIAKAKGWPISGCSFKIKDGKAIDIQVNNMPLHENLMYKLAISDYLVNGGDNIDFLKSCKKKTTAIFIRDTLMEYLLQLSAKNQSLHPIIENRISYAE